MNDEETLRRLEEAEAWCAALREVLEEVEELPWEAYSQQGEGMLGEGNWLRTELRKGEKILRHVREVLRSDAGRDFLNRLRRLETVAEAARELVNKPTYRPELRDGWHAAWSKLREVLAALEETKYAR